MGKEDIFLVTHLKTHFSFMLCSMDAIDLAVRTKRKKENGAKRRDHRAKYSLDP